MAGLLNLLFPGQDYRGEELALRRQAMEEQRSIRERQEALGAIQTLGQILNLDKARRGPMIKMAGEHYGAKYGMDTETLTKWASQVDDETAANLGEMLRAVGVETKGDPKALLQAFNPGQAFEAILKASQAAQAKAQEAERNKVAGTPIPKGLPATMGGAEETGEGYVHERAPQGKDEMLALLDTQEQALMGIVERMQGMGGVSEAQQRALSTRLGAIKDARERLTGGGQNLHFDTVGGQRAGFNPKTGERVATLGPVEPKEPGTLSERFATAEADAQAKPDDAAAHQRYKILKRAYDAQLDMERARAEGRRDVAMETPLNPKERSSMLHPQTRRVPPAGLTRGQAITQGYLEVDDKDREALADLQQSKTQVGLLTTLAGRLITAENPAQAAMQFTKLTAGAMTGSNAAARTYQQTRDAFLGTLARSLGGERGVLTNQDIARIGSALASFGDTKTVAAAKAEILNALIQTAESGRYSKMFGEPMDEAAIRQQIEDLVGRLESVGAGTRSRRSGSLKDAKERLGIKD